mmetsp:Transcript_18381/g.40880  ORF Transcript_18381/g.40880 Transcript_18381/m.40880 type:complete len:150 (+) Transcript_18381:232-681(+)
MFPVVYKTYGPRAMIAAVVVTTCTLLPYSAYQFYLQNHRHVYHKYMGRGRAATSGADTASATDNNLSEEERERMLDQHDPYDPTEAWQVYSKLAAVSRSFARRDDDFSGIVELPEYLAAEERDRQIEAKKEEKRAANPLHVGSERDSEV